MKPATDNRPPRIILHRASPERLREAARLPFAHTPRRHWTFYLERGVIVLALTIMAGALLLGFLGCSYDASGVSQVLDGSPSADAQVPGDASQNAPDTSFAMPDAMLAQDAGSPPSWTGTYTLSWNEISRTCASPVSIGYDRLVYVEGTGTASWQNSSFTVPVAANLSPDRRNLTVTGWRSSNSRMNPVSFTQDAPRSITGTAIRDDLNDNCSATYVVRGVR